MVVINQYHTIVIVSHYREVARWEIFLEQELRFGQIWAGSATFEAGFFMFSWAKKHCNVRTKKLLKINMKKYIIISFIIIKCNPC